MKKQLLCFLLLLSTTLTQIAIPLHSRPIETRNLIDINEVLKSSTTQVSTSNRNGTEYYGQVTANSLKLTFNVVFDTSIYVIYNFLTQFSTLGYQQIHAKLVLELQDIHQQ